MTPHPRATSVAKPGAFPALDPASRATMLNRAFTGLGAADMLREALRGDLGGRLALVSSFGAESVVLLHLAALADPSTPVIFLDTEMLFPETLAYQAEVAGTLGLRDVRIVRPAAVPEEIDAGEPLHQRDPDACCALRKSLPLSRALAGFDGWITGRKRHQGGARVNLPKFETDENGMLKLNPLADWSVEQVRAYIAANDLPRHPLVARGYPSIGCAPCTSPVKAGEDPRAGRWRGRDKTECGIHFVNGEVVRGAA